MRNSSVPNPSKQAAAADQSPAASLAGIAGSNSLADLAARINAEHEAATSFMQQSLDRAIRAGELLIEAKKQLNKHGGWLAWLRGNCQVPERTAQLYMHIARNADEIRNVADLTLRGALSWVKEIKHAERLARRASYTLETPRAMLPTPAGRRMRIARHREDRQWMLAIGPNISRGALLERQEAARKTAAVQQLELERKDLLDRAAELEAEAKAVRERAEAVRRSIDEEVRAIIGPAEPFTETYTFKASEKVDSELAALGQEELAIERLLAALQRSVPGLTEIERGFWGDMHLMGSLSPQMTGRGRSVGPGGWTKVGSPEWLDELFPNWNGPDDKRDAAEQPSVADAEVRS